MKKIIYSLFLLLVILSCAHRRPETKKATTELLVQAYTFGFPLVMLDMLREIDTNVTHPDPSSGRAPLNQFVHHQSDEAAELQLSTAWLDLSLGPQVLEIPDTEGRYYFMPMMDAWSNVFMSPGKRTTGPGARKYVLVGPEWNGEIPEGLEFIRSKTDLLWIIGRTQASGKSDIVKVKKLQNEYKLYPLESLGRIYQKPLGIKNNNLDMQPPFFKIFATSGEQYFQRLNTLMKHNPPTGEDYLLIKKFETIGISPGKKFDIEKFDEKEQSFIKNLPKLMKERFEVERQLFLAEHTGWFTPREMGNYGTNYSKRAVLAYVGFSTNQDEDAIYPFISRDAEGRKFISDKRYVLHFRPEEIPETNAFFSFATFHPDSLVLNHQKAFSSLFSHRDLKTNPDRSLDIYIQKDSPGKEKESNWLRVPEGEFFIGAQLFWPKLENMTDSWTLPLVYEADKVRISEHLTEE